MVIIAGGVLVSAEMCFPVFRALDEWAKEHERRGAMVRPELRKVVETLRGAGMNHILTADVRSERTSERTSPDIAASCEQALTTGAMALRLGVSERHARRLATVAGVAPVSRGRWHAEDVAALVAARR